MPDKISAFLFKLKTTANAVYFPLSGTAFRAKQNFTVGTSEKLIVPTVFYTLDELTDFCFPVGRQFDVFLVFGCTFIMVAGKHAKKRKNV